MICAKATCQPILIVAGLLALAGCDADAAPAQAAQETPAAASGTPAQPLTPELAGEIHTKTQIIAQQDTSDESQLSCTIRFAYAGYPQETLIWRDEPCSALTATFFDQGDLAKFGKWERLDDHARARIAAAPEGKVLYVEGAFTASIYPIDINQLTYEVSVAD